MSTLNTSNSHRFHDGCDIGYNERVSVRVTIVSLYVGVYLLILQI